MFSMMTTIRGRLFLTTNLWLEWTSIILYMIFFFPHWVVSNLQSVSIPASIFSKVLSLLSLE